MLDVDTGAWSALGELYHRQLTGTLLSVVTRCGEEDAAVVVFRMLRRQQIELFLPGLRKLGLESLPPAVACAQYHVLSNSLGGVGVSWIPESDRKSWVRYRPPRWIWDGTAVCGIPSRVSRAQMHAWHANNGVLLNNPNLGFVCTMQTADGQPGLVGYYVEEDRPLAPEERLRFDFGQRPPGPSVALPVPQWDPTRLAKVERNYSLAYIRSLLPELVSVLGPGEAAFVGNIAARQVGMQYRDVVITRLGMDALAPLGAAEFAGVLARLIIGHGDDADVIIEGDTAYVEQSGWRLMRDLEVPDGVFEAWSGLWAGMANLDDLRLDAVARAEDDSNVTWRVRAI
jgi:hypothetical protein